ncbi:ankyrin [Hypoxylon sp. FL1150]|nr:ankyrin [Hypoxylon sp. FL1150]
MAARARKIPQSHWDGHKDTILNLYLSLDLSMERLVETMEHNHGFTATISQFEAQLRSWKARKNLRIHEWERVLETTDALANQGVKSRVLISNHVVSTNKIRRAKRHCKADESPRKRRRLEENAHDDTTNNEIDSDVAIEIQDSNGQWSLYTTPVGRDIIPGPGHQTSSGTQQEGYGVLSPLLQSTNPILGLDNWFAAAGNEGSLSMNFSLDECEVPEVPQPSIQNSLSAFNPELCADDIFTNLELAFPPSRHIGLARFPPATSYFHDLPFEQFKCELVLNHLQRTTSQSPMQGSILFSGVHKHVYDFAADASTIMTETNGKSPRENFDFVRVKLQTLHSTLPRTQQHEPLQMTKEAEFYRLLFYSLANGFGGLDGIPIQAISIFLNRYNSATSLLSRLFQDNAGHATKGLAETLFRAAIESGDHNTTNFFIRAGLVNVNTSYLIRGIRFSPLERAAQLQHLKVVKELLRFKPEIGQSFSDKPDFGFDGGVLELLIEGRLLQVTELLIESGVKIRYRSIYNALRYFARKTLAVKLLCRLAPSDHSEGFSRDSFNQASLLQVIASELTDEEATEAIVKILSDCKQTKCEQCLIRFKDELSYTVVAGAKRVRQSGAAIRSGNQELIEFVLAQKPDVSRDNPMDLDLNGNPDPRRYTTPLAEAIDAEDNMLMKKLENEGALENLGSGSGYATRFACAIAAASKVGNFEYVKLLLLHYPQVSRNEILKSLVNAMKHRQEVVVRLFLNIGRITHHWQYPSFKFGTHIVVEAFKWGDQSTNLGNFIEFIHQSGLLTRDGLTRCLAIAIKRKDSVMLNNLLESGADAMDDKSITTAVEYGENDMLQILLKHIPTTKKPVKQFGTGAISTAIQQPSNIEALELLLACTAVDFNSLRSYGQNSPLGTAIEQDAASGRSDFPLTRRLLDAGCNTDQIVEIGGQMNKSTKRTALLKAIQIKSNGLVQFLISRGADVNREATLGIQRTPLQAAAEQNSLDLVKLLLQNNANADDKPARYQGATALQCAATGGNCNMAALLLDNGASLYSPSSVFGGRSSLQGAADLGVTGVGFPREDCLRAMELAQGNGYLACRNLILDIVVEGNIVPMVEGSGQSDAVS